MLAALKRSQNIKNSFWNAVNVLFYPALFLAATPHFLRLLGEADFGVWMVLNAVAMVCIHLSHFGLGQSITLFVAASRGEGRSQRIHHFYTAGLNFTLLVAAAFVALGALGLAFWPWKQSVFHTDHDTYTAIVLTMPLIAIRLLDQHYQGFFKGFEQYGVAARVSTGTRVATLALQWAVAPRGLVAVVGAALLVGAAAVVWQKFRSRRFVPGYRWQPVLLKAHWRRLASFGFWAWLQTAISLVSSQLDKFLVAAFLGPAVVAYYSLASTVLNHLHMFIEAPVGWMFPKISRLRANAASLVPHYITLRSLIAVAGSLLIATIYLFRGLLFSLWLGPEKAVAFLPFMEVFLLFQLFQTSTIAPKFFLNGLNRTALITAIEAGYRAAIVVGMCLSFWLFGTAESLVWGQCVAIALSVPVVAWVINRKVVHFVAWHEVVGASFPTLIVLATLLVPELWLQLVLGAAALVALHVFHLRHPWFRRSLLLE